jgi:hypothetical protein
MNNQLIIARYNEDLFWLNEWQSQFDIVVYNKGKDDLKQDYKIINLPNIGREAHTYLYHIVNNYDTLAENNIFLQGNIKDLGPNVYQDLNCYLNEIKEKGYSANGVYYTCGNYYKNIDFLADPLYKDQVLSKHFRLSDITFKDYILKHFKVLPVCMIYSMKGCFGVSKKNIQSRPKEFYLNLLDSIPDYHTVEEAHFLERLWAFIFTEKVNL